jgi:hypothetical protein
LGDPLNRNHGNMNSVNVLYIACGIACLVLVARQIPAGALLNRAKVACAVCIIAAVIAGTNGDASAARLVGAAALPMAAGLGAVIVFALLRMRLSR